MEAERKKKWLPILYFTITGVIFATGVYLITAGAIASNQPTETAVASAVSALPYPDEPRILITLQRDTRQRMGKLDVIYRGVQNRKLHLDVFILDLDPEYAYRHAIALDQARRGFRLGGVRMELRSAWRSRAKILWDRQG
ncbi:MAG: hypothetical protein PVJ53_08860 [Desulfobacterales bacterium]|jgi:hypothetical protein